MLRLVAAPDDADSPWFIYRHEWNRQLVLVGPQGEEPIHGDVLYREWMEHGWWLILELCKTREELNKRARELREHHAAREAERAETGRRSARPRRR